MITVEQAWELIRARVPVGGTVRVPLADAPGRVLREAVTADRDYPPYDRVTMDGIALSHPAWLAGRRSFRVEKVLLAGAAPVSLQDPDSGCIQVMTGAVMPGGCTCVAPIEDLELHDGQAELRAGLELASGAFIHRQGSDRKAGDLLLEAGVRLHAPQMAVAVSTGRTQVLVDRPPAVAMVSTGDEIVEPGAPAEAWQIRPSNVWGMAAALRGLGLPPPTLRKAGDHGDALREVLRYLLETHDVLVLSGGVSMGVVDLVPGTLEQIGFRCLFHKISQKPGKPMWFGCTDTGKLAFALPGNPVSALVCFHRYVIPALRLSLGERVRPVRRVRLSADTPGSDRLTLFLPVHLEEREGVYWAETGRYGGSGDLNALGQSDGFVELPTAGVHKAGSVVQFFPWHE